MRIALLGPLEVCDDSGAPLDVAGVRLRRLLARLALDPGRLVTAESLVDAVWGDHPPAGVTSALQSLASRLRRSLASDGKQLESQPAGYRLRVPAEAVDIGRFEQLAAAGRAASDAGDLAAAARWFTQALDLWRGEPLADLGHADFAVTAVARLEELRLRTVEDRAEVKLAGGEADDVIAELAQWARRYPLRERMHALHMRALSDAGRPAEALAAFEELRRTLGRELGTDPSPALRDLHVAILRGDAGPRAQPAQLATQPAPPAGAGRGNLRFALTSFVGREEELERVGKLLDEARLVTLVGTGGAGKTRLAVEIAARRAGNAGAGAGAGAGARAAAGAWVVELAGVRDPAKVPAAILAALGLRESGLAPAGPRGATAMTPTEVLVEAMRGRQVLIVLDNCEHLIDACARVADAILGDCLGVRILATSREPLAITGEALCPVGPLAVPPVTAGIEEALSFPAMRLFCDRAAAVRPGFTLTAENLAAVSEVCRRLDGLPLAIELAGARLRTLPVEEVAARLGDRFRLLAAGSRTALPRHQTLLAAVEWSWELFTTQERTLARRLTVFAGGATAESAQAVCAGGELSAGDVPEVLGALVDKSFVQLIEVRDAPPRYRMLETIRAYSAASLEEAGEAGEASRIRRAHAGYFLAQAETAEPALRTADQVRWLTWLTSEYENLTTALRWAVDAADTETAVRLTAALGWFWEVRGSHDEASAWLREALALPGVDDPGTVPAAPLAVAYAFDAMYHVMSDPGHAIASAGTARRLAEGTQEHPVAVLIGALLQGPSPSFQGPSPSGESAAAALAALAGHPDPWVDAEAELWLAHAAEFSGDAAGSLAHFTSAREKFTAIGDRVGIASAVSSLGTGHGLTGEHAAAIAAFGEAEQLADALGAQDDAGRLRIWRGLERLRAGDLAGAREDLTRAREAGHARRSAEIVAFAEVGLGELARRDGELAEARTLLAGALARVDQLPGPPGDFVRVHALTGLGRVDVAAADLTAARAQLDAGLKLALRFAHGPMIATATEALAGLSAAAGEYGDAARLLGLAAAARGAADRGSPDVARTESAARAALPGSFDAVYAAAAGLSPADAAAALSRQE